MTKLPKSLALTHPKISPLSLPLPPPLPEPITHDTPENYHNVQDALLLHHVATALHVAWQNIYTLDSLNTLANLTFKLIEQRRRLTHRPYGLKDTSSRKSDVVLPID